MITAISSLKHDRGYKIDHMTETCDFLIILAQVTTNEEAFAEASSQLALAPPYTPEEEDEEDNTEKREIMEADGPNDIDSQDVQSKGQSFIHLPNLQPVILNSRQERRGGGSSQLPPDVLARIHHITDIHNLPPLPSGARPFAGPVHSPR